MDVYNNWHYSSFPGQLNHISMGKLCKQNLYKTWNKTFLINTGFKVENRKDGIDKKYVWNDLKL